MSLIRPSRFILPTVCFLLLPVLFFRVAFAQVDDEFQGLNEALKLRGIALFKAVSKATPYGYTRLPQAERLRILERLCEESEDALQDQDAVFARILPNGIYATACANADVEDLPRLIELFEKFPERIRMSSEMLVPLAPLWIRQELTQIAAEQPIQLKPEPLTNLPDSPYSPPLTAARNAYLAAIQPYLALPRKYGFENTGYNQYPNEYAEMILSLLKREKNGGEELRSSRLLSYVEGRGCIRMPDNPFDDSKAFGVWMALLAERNFPAAVGAALQLQSDEPAATEPVLVTFLKQCDLDWEQICLGALADEIAEDWKKSKLQDKASAVILSTLTAYGSEQCVPMLMEISRQAGKKEWHWNTLDREKFYRALAAFVQPSSEEKRFERYRSYGQPTFERKKVPPASEETQRQILEFFAQTAQEPDIGLKCLESLVRILSRLRRPETKELLLACLKHPSQIIPELAYETLGKMGENVEKPGLPEPVRFLFLENGQPLRNFSIRWDITYSSTTGMFRPGSDTDVTDENGILRVVRNRFADPDKKSFSSTLTFNSHRDKEPPSVIFSIEVAAPSDLSQTTTVQMETKPLILMLESNRKPDEGETVQVTVKDLENWRVNDRWQMPYTQKLTLPNLQPSKYLIIVRAPRTALAQIEIEHPQAEPSPIKLEPGADVKIKLHKPDDVRRVMCELYREGEKVSLERAPDYEWKGLPLGRYRLSISSGGEQPSFEAVDIPFTIDENSPAVIDLGEIRLKALPTESEKP